MHFPSEPSCSAAIEDSLLIVWRGFVKVHCTAVRLHPAGPTLFYRLQRLGSTSSTGLPRPV